MRCGMTREEIEYFVDTNISFIDGLKADSKEIIDCIKKDCLWYAVLAVPVLETEYEKFRRDFLEIFVQKWSDYAEKANKQFIDVGRKLGDSVRHASAEENLQNHLENYPLVLTEFDKDLSMLYIYFRHMIFENIYVRQDTKSVQIVLYRYNKVLKDTIESLCPVYDSKLGLSILYVHDTVEQGFDSFANNLLSFEKEDNGFSPDQEKDLISTVFEEESGKLYSVYSPDGVLKGVEQGMYGDFLSYLKENPYNSEKYDILFRHLE